MPDLGRSADNMNKMEEGRSGSGVQLPPEVHGAVQDPHDLKGLARDPEEDDVLPLSGELAGRKEVIPVAVDAGILPDLLKSPPHGIQVGLLLGGPPSLQGIGPDGSEILQGGAGKLEPHDSARIAARKSSLEPIATV